MICPTCNAWTRVLETRSKYNNETYRRYECANGRRFSTMESVKLQKVKDENYRHI
jgi:transcriptional regulator NrdR family protein